MKKKFLFICFILISIRDIARAQENLKIAWPGEYKWKIGSNQKSGNTRMVELIPGNETLNNWTIIGTMVSLMGSTRVSVEQAMNMTYSQTLKTAPRAKLKMVEKGIKAGAPWVLFRIESPRESQLYYMIQGKQALYSNFVAVKQPVGVLFVEKWVRVFKASELAGN